MHGNNNFTKKDPLIDAVAKVMQENELRRQVERQFNEELGIESKKALPFQKHAEYDRVLAEKTQQALNEELKGNQAAIDANKNGKVDGQDFKILRAKKQGQMNEADYPPGVSGKDTSKEGNPDMKKGSPDEEKGEKETPMPPKRPANLEEAEYSAKTARAGKDIGKPGKNFEKIAKKAGEKYGSEERGKKVAGAILAKIRAKYMEEAEQIDEISAELKARYARKADQQVNRTSSMGVAKRTGGVGIEDTKRKIENRKAGIKRTMSEEQIDEGTDPRDSRREFERPNNSLNTAWDRLATRLPYDTKRSKKSNAGQQSGLKHSIKSAMGKHGPKGHLPEEVDQIDEKAPPGDKYERMVKHIKAKYSKGGLSDKEKSIAYATAWKAKNKDSE